MEASQTPSIPEFIPHPLEIVIPQSVRKDLLLGAAEFSEALQTFTPDLLIVLRRAGSTVFPAVAEHAKKNGILLPPATHIYLGRDTIVRFKHDSGIQMPEMDVPSVETWEKYEEAFISWLESDELAGRQIAKLKAAISQPKNIVVLDDARFMGMTLDHTVPSVLRHVFGNTIKIHTLTVFQKNSWQQDIIQTSINPSDDASAYFIEEVASGYGQTPQGLKKIQTPDDLAMIGEYTGKKRGVNPYAAYVATFGEKTLLHLHTKMILALKQTVLTSRQ